MADSSDTDTKDEKEIKSNSNPSQLEKEDEQKSSSEDEKDKIPGNQWSHQEEGPRNQSSAEDNVEDQENLSESKKKDQQEMQSSTENADEDGSTHPSGSDKQPGEVSNQILDLPEDLEGMSAPPASDVERLKAKAKSRPFSPWARKEPIVRRTRTVIRPASKQKDDRKPKSKEKANQKTTKKKTKKPALSSGTTSEDNEDKPTTDVKTFSYPHYKILSGATVAPVKMRPQKVMLPRRLEEDSKHWAEGLFQPSKLSLKLRLLRLLLVWIFFRVLNKQTGWLAERLGLGLADELGPPPPRPKHPDERYVRVFHESSPHPIHVRVRPPPQHPYS